MSIRKNGNYERDGFVNARSRVPRGFRKGRRRAGNTARGAVWRQPLCFFNSKSRFFPVGIKCVKAFPVLIGAEFKFSFFRTLQISFILAFFVQAGGNRYPAV